MLNLLVLKVNKIRFLISSVGRVVGEGASPDRMVSGSNPLSETKSSLKQFKFSAEDKQ